MGRLMTIAVLIAAVAGVITIAAGGVDIHHAKHRTAVDYAAGRAAAVRQSKAHVGAVVGMRGLAFTRPHVTIAAGESVRFFNHDNVDHTVYATLGGVSGNDDFHSPRIAVGHSFTSPVLSQPGTYSYVCTLHPTVMTGVITVTG